MAKDYISVSEYNKLKEANGGKEPTKSMVSSYISQRNSGATKTKAANTVVSERQKAQQDFTTSYSSGLDSLLSSYNDNSTSWVKNYNSRVADKQYQGKGTQADLDAARDYYAQQLQQFKAQYYKNNLSRHKDYFDQDYIDSANAALDKIISGSKDAQSTIKNQRDYWKQFTGASQYIAAMNSYDQYKAQKAEEDRIKNLDTEATTQKIKDLQAQRDAIAAAPTQNTWWENYLDAVNTANGSGNGTTYRYTEDQQKQMADLDSQIASLRNDLSLYNENVTKPAKEAERTQYLNTVNTDDLQKQLDDLQAKRQSLVTDYSSDLYDPYTAKQDKQQQNSINDIDSQIAQLTQDLHEAKAAQFYNTEMESVPKSDDYSTLSATNYDLLQELESGVNASEERTSQNRYKYINGDPETVSHYDSGATTTNVGPFAVSAGLTTNTSINSDWNKYKYLTDDEKGVYNYLYATQGYAKADEFLDAMEEKLTARSTADISELLEEQATENAATAISASAFSVLAAPLSGLSYLGQALDYADDGYIDPNAGYNLYSSGVTTTRSAIAQEASKFWQSKGFSGEVAGDAYNSLMSFADFMYQAALGRSIFGTGTKAAEKACEAFTLGIMGTSSAANQTIESLNDGYNSSQAFTIGTIAGMAEIISEKVSLEALFSEAHMNANAVKYLLQNWFFEGSEEVGSDFINLFADILVLKDQSEWQKSIDEYKLQGYTEKEAFVKAVTDEAKQMGKDYFWGALSGLAASGIQLGVNTYRNSAQGKDLMTSDVVDGKRQYFDSPDALANSIIDEAMQEDEGTEARTVAEKMQAKRNAGKQLTRNDLGKLFNATTNTQYEAAGADKFDYRTRKVAEYQHKMAAQLAQEGKIQATEATKENAVKTVKAEVERQVAGEVTNKAYKDFKAIMGVYEEEKDKRVVIKADSASAFTWDKNNNSVMVNVTDENGSELTLSAGVKGDAQFSPEMEDAVELAKMVNNGTNVTDEKLLDDSVRTAIACRMAGTRSSKEIYLGYMTIYGAARNGMTYAEAITSMPAGSSERASINLMTDEQKALAYRAGENVGRITSPREATYKSGRGVVVKTTGRISKRMRQTINTLGDILSPLQEKVTIYDAVNIDELDALAKDGMRPITWMDPSTHRINGAYIPYKNGGGEYVFAKNSLDHSLMFVAVHESLHDIRANLKGENGRLGEDIYQQMFKLVKDFYEKQGVYDSMLENELSKISESREDRLDAAQEELVANALPAILANETTMEQFAELVATSDGASQNAFERFMNNIRKFLREALEFLTDPKNKQKSWSMLKAIRDDQELVNKLYDLYEQAYTRLAAQNKAAAQMAGMQFTERQVNDIINDQQEGLREMPERAGAAKYSVIDKNGNIMSFSEDDILRNKIDVATMENVYDVAVNNFKKSEEKDLVTMGKEYFESVGGSVYNDILGNVALDVEGLKHLVGQHLTWRKSATIEAIPYVISNGKIVDLSDEHKDYGFGSVIIAAPVSLEGHDCFMGVAVKQDHELKNSYYMHDVFVIDKKGTAVDNTQNVSMHAETAADVLNSDPIFMILNSIVEIKENLQNYTTPPVSMYSEATYEESDIKPGLTAARAKLLGIKAADITLTANTRTGKKEIVYTSGRSVLAAVMQHYAKDNGMTDTDIDHALQFMDDMAAWMDDVAVAKYHFIGLQDIKDAKMKIDWRNGKQVVLSARVKNGEYDVNFDLTKICKKRQAFSAFIDDLASRPGRNGKATMLDEVDLSPENIFKMNTILKDMGYETACLGCFVESRRYGIKNWAETIVQEWNDRIDKLYPENKDVYFDFAKGSTTATIDTLTAAEIKKIDADMEKYKAAVKQVGVDLTDKTILDQIDSLQAEKKARKSDINTAKGMTKDEKKAARAAVDAEIDPQIKELKMNATAKMEPLMQNDPRLQKKLRVGDLISSQGRTALHEYSAELESIIASRFGTSSPKSVEAFAPYNSEIALLPDKKNIGRGENKITMTQQEYLSSIAGVRSQSFSDFIITHFYDHLQKTADCAARGFKAHTYTKEISRALLFGMTGEKINMSVMFDIKPDVPWEYAGLQEADINSEYSVADYLHGRTKAEALAREQAGLHEFTYSIPFEQAVAEQQNPLRSASIGIIGVGHSYYGMLKMFRDSRIPYIIGYHRSSQIEEILKATHLELSADYTNVQNTLKLSAKGAFREVTNWDSTTVPSYATWGMVAKKETKASDKTFDLKACLAKHNGDGRAAMNEFLTWMNDNHLTPSTSKAQAGHGSFDLYGDLEKTGDYNVTGTNYINWCIENDMVPQFFEFAAEEDYSKILYDFSVRDLGRLDENGRPACSPQVPVSMKGLVDYGKDEWIKILDKYMSAYNTYMQEQFFGEKYAQTLDQIYDAVKLSEMQTYDMDLPKNEAEAEEAQSKFSVIDEDWGNVPWEDKEKARADFEAGGDRLIKVYRAMQLVDGKLYPPMAAVVDGEMVGGVTEGDLVMSDERPDLAEPVYWDHDGKYHVSKDSPLYGMTYKAGDQKLDENSGKPVYVFILKKGTRSDDGNKQTDVPARYNPYIHTSRSLINDQFSSAWNRSHLVTVEVEIPASELTSGYWADKAKDPVGEMTWKSGPVSGELAKNGDPRLVIISRYCKIGRIVPTSEVADIYAAKVNKYGIGVPFNTVNPAVRDALVERGVNITEPQTGSAGKGATPSYNEWLKTQQESGAKYSAADETEPTAKYSAAYDYTRSWNQQVKDFENGIIPANDTLLLGRTPAVYKSIGLTALPMVVDAKHLRYWLGEKYINENGDEQTNHIMDRKDLDRLPTLISEPLAIIASNSQNSSEYSIVAYVEMKIDGDQVIAPVTISTHGMENGILINANKLSSAYSKNNALDELADALGTDTDSNIRVFYIDKNRTPSLITDGGKVAWKDDSTKNHALQLLTAIQHDGNSVIHKITDSGSPVKKIPMAVTESMQFKAWFNRSKAVSSDGSPLQLYYNYDLPAKSSVINLTHDDVYGDSIVLSRNNGGGVGLYASIQKPFDPSMGISSAMVENLRGSNIAGVSTIGRNNREATLKMLSNASASAGVSMADILKTMGGFDGIHDGDTWVAYSSYQVKSSDKNRGTFFKDTPKIKFSAVDDTADTAAVRSAVMEQEKTLKVLADLAKGNGAKLVTDEKLSRRQINKIARDVIKRWGSDANYKDVADILYEAYSPAFSGEEGTDTFSLFADAAAQIIDACQGEGKTYQPMNDMAAAVNAAAGDQKIMLTASETQVIKSAYGSIAEFRRALKKYGITANIYQYKNNATGYVSSDDLFNAISNSSSAYMFTETADGYRFVSMLNDLDNMDSERLYDIYDETGENNDQHVTREQAIINLQAELAEQACQVRAEAIGERASREAAELTADENNRLQRVSKQLANTAAEIRAEIKQYAAEEKAKQARTADLLYEMHQETVQDYEARIGAINDELAEMKKLDGKRRAKIHNQEQALMELKSNLMAARDELKARARSMALMDAMYARDMDTAVKMQAGITAAELRKKYAEKLASLRADKKAIQADYNETMTAYNRVLADVTRQAKKDVKAAYTAGRKARSAEVVERDLRRAYRQRIAARTKTLANMLTSPTKTKYVPEGARTAVTGYVEVMADHKTKINAAKLTELANWYRSMGKGEITQDEAQDLQNMFDEDIYDRIIQLGVTLGGRRLSDLTSDELKEVDEIGKVFYHIARHYDDVRRRGRSESLKVAADTLMGQLSGMEDRRDYGDLDKVAAFLVNNQTPYYFFKGVGGELQSFYNDIDDGVKTYTMNVQQAAKKVASIKEQFDYDSWSKDTEDNEIKIKTASGRTVALSRGEAMLIWATNKREQINQQQKANHLKSGGIVMQEDRKTGKNKGLTAVANRLTDANLTDIDAWLTDQQKACADALVQYLSSDMADLGNEVSMQLYGINKFEEQYYIPYNCAGTYLNKQIGGGAANLDQLLKSISFSQRLTTRADAPILVDDIFAVASRHIERMCMYNGLCIPLDNMNRLLNYKTREKIAVDEDGVPVETPLDENGNPIKLYNDDGTINTEYIDIHYDEEGYPLTKTVVGDSVRTMLTAKYGSNVVKYIDTFLADMNGASNVDPRESFGSRMLGLFKKNAVMMSASVAIQQPSAIGRAFALVNPKYFVRTAVTKHDYQELSKYSYTAVLKSIGGFDTGTGRGIADWINGGAAKATDAYGKVLDFVDEYGGKAPEFMDQVTWAHIWNAIKLEQQDLHPDLQGEDLLKAAGTRFDEVINATQVYDSTISRSANMRSKSWYMKALTSFMAEPTVAYNLLTDAIREGVQNKNVGYAGRAAASFVTAALLNSLLKSLVTAARKEDDDETYGEAYTKEFIGNMFSELNPFGLIPIAKDVLSIFQGYTVSRSDMDAIQDVKDAWDALNSENKSVMDKINAVAGAVSIFSGVPIKNVMRDVEAVGNIITNGIKNAGKGSAQGTRLAVEEAMSEVWPFSIFVKSSNKDYAARIISAYKKGDTDEVEATIRDYQFKLDRSGKTADEIAKSTTSWLKGAIKDAYNDGSLDYETAYKMLHEIADIDEKVAFKTLQSVDYADTEYGDSTSAYVGLYDAIDNGKDIEAAVQKMISSGYAEDDVRDQVVYGVLTLYKGQVEGHSKIDKSTAKSMLTKYGKLSSDKADEKIKQANVYLTYGVEYTTTYSNLKEALANGTLTKEQCIKILMSVRGYDRSKAAEIVSGWNK